jgi:hypothetical protein
MEINRLNQIDMMSHIRAISPNLSQNSSVGGRITKYENLTDSKKLRYSIDELNRQGN